MDERRSDSRRPLDYDVTCYIDGARLDAHALNVSRRGAFVGTDLGRPVPVGALAGLVFVSETQSSGTTFLFGRVIRQQDVPVRGFAVRWEKAVSAGRPTDLKGFLSEFLGVDDAGVDEEVIGPSGPGASMTRCVFRFEPFDISAPDDAGNEEVYQSLGGGRRVIDELIARPVPADIPIEIDLDLAGLPEVATPVMPSTPAIRHHQRRASSKKTGQDLGELEEFIGNLDVSEEEISAVRIGNSASPIHVPPLSVRQPVQSALPVLTEAGPDSVACEMEGAVVIGDARLNVMVTGLSPSAAVVRSRFMPVDPASAMVLELMIGSRKGVTSVRCHGRVSGVQHGADCGFIVAFSRLDEGDSPGIFERYLKWLKFNGPV